MINNRFLLLITIILTILYAFGIAGSVKADPRMETRDGFCHFQIDPNDQNVEVFAGVCLNSIFVYDNDGHDEADGDAIWVKQYINGRTPIGSVKRLLQRRATGEQSPKRCKNTWTVPTEEIPPSEDLLCRVRLTGERTGYDCALVDSNGNEYDTQFWTAVYELTADGMVKYTLTCRNAQENN